MYWIVIWLTLSLNDCSQFISQSWRSRVKIVSSHSLIKWVISPNQWKFGIYIGLLIYLLYYPVKVCIPCGVIEKYCSTLLWYYTHGWYAMQYHVPQNYMFLYLIQASVQYDLLYLFNHIKWYCLISENVFKMTSTPWYRHAGGLAT